MEHLQRLYASKDSLLLGHVHLVPPYLGLAYALIDDTSFFFSNSAVIIRSYSSVVPRFYLLTVSYPFVRVLQSYQPFAFYTMNKEQVVQMAPFSKTSTKDNFQIICKHSFFRSSSARIPLHSLFYECSVSTGITIDIGLAGSYPSLFSLHTVQSHLDYI